MSVWYESEPQGRTRRSRLRPLAMTPESQELDSEGFFREDVELVRRVEEGDPQARELFLGRALCIGQVLGAKNRRLGSPFSSADLNDLAQETFLQVWSRLGTYRGTGSLEAWLYRFCCNVLGNALQRRARATRSLDSDEREDPEDGKRFSDEDFLESERLLAALDGLEESVGAVLRLKLIQDLTFEALAERLGISANTAKTRYYRGVEAIRAHLERGSKRRNS